MQISALLKNVKILNGQNLFKSLQKVYRYDEPKKTSKDEKYLFQDQVEDFSFYTDVVFPLQKKDLEEIRLYDKPFLAKIETEFEQTTVWSVDKAALNKQREIQIEKRVDDKLEKLQLHENIDSQFVNSYQDQLGKDLFILNFKAAKGKDFYVNVKKQKLKNILSNPSKNKKGNLSFLNYLHECIKSFDIGSDDDLPETFRRLLPTNNQTKENIEIFPMFFNKYEYEDASNNYSLETIDYRIAEEKYDPSEKQYFRKRLLCFSSSSAAYSDIDEKAREYIGNLIKQIQSKGEKYDPETPDEDLEKQLKQHTRDLNTMLTLYNFHDATAVRTCALLFYIVATSFPLQRICRTTN